MVNSVSSIKFNQVAFYSILTVVAPPASLMVIPILGSMRGFSYCQHTYWYQKTLTHHTRRAFGRIEGQNYKRWVGKEVFRIDPNFDEIQKCIHSTRVFHGHSDGTIDFEKGVQSAGDCPFKSQDDLVWLKKEKIRYLRERDFRLNLDTLRVAFKKSLEYPS